ncbi:MAG TPA: hypothetical protein VGC96_08445 [Candidatus Elarobacter sp.]
MRVPTLCAAFAAALIMSATAIAQAETPAPDQIVAQPAIAAPVVVAPADQATPNPAASPAGQTNPRPGAPNAPTPGSAQSPSGGPSATRIPPGPPPLGHWPIIDFVATFTQPAYYGNRNAIPAAGLSPVNRYDPVDLGGTVRIPITRKFNLLFDRITEGTLNQPLECVLQPASPVPGAPAGRVCPSDSRDILLQYHATYAFNRFLTLDVGDSFRHRIWTNGANGVSTVPYLCNNNGRSTGANCTVSSTEHHFGYATVIYTTKPLRDLWNSQFSFAESFDRQNVDHHVGMVCSAALIGLLTTAGAANQLTCPNGNGNVGYYDENPGTSAYWETTQGITWIMPLDIRHGVTLTLNDRWGALNFYENPTINPAFGTTTGQPYRWASAFTYQLNKRFSPGFTLAMRHSDFHSLATQGTPFVSPNHIHVGSWDLIGTFHLDTNTWFH